MEQQRTIKNAVEIEDYARAAEFKTEIEKLKNRINKIKLSEVNENEMGNVSTRKSKDKSGDDSGGGVLN